MNLFPGLPQPMACVRVIGFQAKGVKPGGPESYNSRSISSLTTTEDMSAKCAAF